MTNKMIPRAGKRLSNLKELFLKYKWLASSLLDPTSNAAVDAAAIDQGEEYSDGSKYKDSWIYADLKELTEFLYGLQRQHKDQLDIRYTKRLPHTFIILGLAEGDKK